MDGVDVIKSGKIRIICINLSGKTIAKTETNLCSIGESPTGEFTATCFTAGSSTPGKIRVDTDGNIYYSFPHVGQTVPGTTIVGQISVYVV